MFTNFKVHYRLIVLFMMVGLLPTLFGAALVLDRMNETVKANALTDLEGRRDSKQLSIERWFSTRIANLEMLSRSTIAQDVVERLSISRDAQTLLDIRTTNEAYLARFIREYGFDEVLVTDQNGLILFTSDTANQSNIHVSEVSPALKKAHEQAMFGGAFVTDLTREGDQSQRSFLYISSVVIDRVSKQPVGTAIARLPRETLSGIMTERAGMGDTGDAFIVGSDDLARSELTFSENQRLGNSDVLNTRIQSRAIRQAFSGIKGVSEEVDYRGQQVLASYSKLAIPHLEWALVVKIDLAEVLVPIYELQTLLSILAVMVILVVSIFGWFAARGFSQPMVRLTEYANNLAAGKLVNRIEVSGQDEVADLSSALLNIQDSAVQAAEVASELSNGNLVSPMALRSPDDSLAISLNQLLSVSNEITAQANAVADGDYTQSIVIRSDNDNLSIALNSMSHSLAESTEQINQNTWLQQGIAELNGIVLGERKLERLADRVLVCVAEQLEIVAGAFYVNTSDSDIDLGLFASYAFNHRKHGVNRFKRGEGLVGQAALEGKALFVEQVPDHHLRLETGLGESPATAICVLPLIFENRVMGVIELATLHRLTTIQQQYVDNVGPAIATSFEIIQSRQAIEAQQTKLQAINDELVEQTESLRSTENELLAQQQNLQQANQTLEQQTRELEASQAELEAQQAQVEVINDDLQHKNHALEQQAVEMEETRRIAALKADDLAVANRYKSEFLANMSHELRTPLNSLLLLARSFQSNEAGNLSEDQVKEAGIIYDSGSDLLNLINEILDLAKIEAGRIELRPEEQDIEEIVTSLHGQFKHMAASQGLEFEVIQSTDLPKSLVTDPLRLGQIIKNLVSNAIKFTEQGAVTVSFERVDGDKLGEHLFASQQLLKIAVSDTGIGIAKDKHQAVFEAFQQLEGGDKRRFGGTGLGLSITKELVNLLGGEIRLESQPGEGSTFSVFMPFTLTVEASPVVEPLTVTNTRAQRPAMDALNVPVSEVMDDREFIDENDDVILIIEDDKHFVKVLMGEITKRGYKSLVALNGEDGVLLASRYLPTGIILDLHLPQMDGWAVLRALKSNIDTRHIPVHIASCDEQTPLGIELGALGHATKPVENDDIIRVIESIEHAAGRDKKYVLLVEDDEQVRIDTARAIGNDVVHIIEADSGEKALSVIHDGGLDLIVLDLNLPDMQGIDVLTQAAKGQYSLPPVIINTARELTMEEESSLREYSQSIVIKDVRSHERLVDEVALFLHRVVKQLPPEKKQIIQHLHQSSEPLRGKTVLIAEDDMRTLFVMTKIMTEFGMIPLKAENGQQALDILQDNPDVDIVLMDMMMPVMDGYETMQTIRSNPQYVDLPIIALTAKAMREDRAKCIEAGASDYMTKPIQQDKLLSLMRVWLSR